MRPRRRGLTLAETIISAFLLVGGLLVMIGLFHSVLRYTTQVEQVVIASSLAEKTMGDIRAWARDITHYRGGLAAYDGVQRSDPDYPDFHIFTEVSKTGGYPIPLLASSCESLDSQFPVAERKNFVNSCRRVRVSVSWHPYTPARTYRLVSFIDEPVFTWRATNPITVTASGLGPLLHNQTVTLTAQGFDSTNGPIPDLIYHWYVEPGSIPSCSTVTSDRMGKTATLTHAVTLNSGSPDYGPPGRVIVTVRAVYRGEERWGASGEVVLL